MSTTITLELPDDVLLRALRRLPDRRRNELLRKLEEPQGLVVKGVQAAELERLEGLIALGGDALEDSERLYDDAGLH
jgi:hypothetical protein